MLPSPSGCWLDPRGYSFSRPQCVHCCYGPVTRNPPSGVLVDRLRRFCFHLLRYPNYGALTSTPAGLSPAEHASLHWTHNWTCRFPASSLYGAFLVKCVTPFLSSFVIPFFCSTRAAEHSSAPTAYFHRRRSQRRSRTELLPRRRRLVLDGREHRGRLRRSGGWPPKDPRGACHWPADQTRTTLVFG